MEKDNKETTKRLNIVIILLFELIDLLKKRLGNKELSETAKMGKLRQFGLNNKEIGILFGKGGKEVAKQIYELKRKKKKKNNKKKQRK